MNKNFELSILKPPIEIETLEIGYEPVSLEIASQSFSNEEIKDKLEHAEHSFCIDEIDLLKLLNESEFHLLCELNSEFDFLPI